MLPFSPKLPAVKISATTSSAAAALTAPDLGSGEGAFTVVVTNLGSVNAFIAFGTSGVTANGTGTGVPIVAGSSRSFSVNRRVTHMAALTVSGTADIWAVTGVGF